MHLDDLTINGFRNLADTTLQFDAGLNIVSGQNGAGKTNLLESIYYLGLARSFRTARIRELINKDQEQFRLVSHLQSGSNHHIIGIERSHHSFDIHLDRATITRSSILASVLPIVAIYPDSTVLITGGPEYRRQFLDWGVFHVKHDFMNQLTQYRKALVQRNAALRQKQPVEYCQLWDETLVQYAQLIHEARLGYLETLEPVVQDIFQSVFPRSKFTLHYRQGWPDDQDYKAALDASIQSDREQGFTQRGIHRADVKFRFDGHAAVEYLSRGQLKKFLSVLKLAQIRRYCETTGQSCVVIYDDMPAELDAENRHMLLREFMRLNLQVFISAINPDDLNYPDIPVGAMFHVEHGQIKKI